MNNIIIAILVFGLIIVVHELGHFAVAKFCGIRVNKFAVGMGPALFKIKKGETEYSLRILPFGGYCAMEGEDQESNDKRAFNNKAIPKRIAVIVAGAFMNLILGLVLIMVVVSSSMDSIATNTVSRFKENSLSSESGLMVGDTIKKINGMIVFTEEDIAYKIVSNEGSRFTLEVERDGKDIILNNVDFYSYRYYRYINKNNSGLYGPYYSYDDATQQYSLIDILDKSKTVYYHDNNMDQYVQVGFIEDGDERSTELQKSETVFDFNVGDRDKNAGSVISYSVRRTATVGQMVWSSLIDLVRGKYKLNDLSGPVGIVQVIDSSIDKGVHFKENLMTVLNIAIFITINLGIVNLLPFPALDGGRLVFLIIEAIRRKPIPPEKEGMVHFVGLALLMMFMLVITFNDIKKIIF